MCVAHSEICLPCSPSSPFRVTPTVCDACTRCADGYGCCYSWGRELGYGHRSNAKLCFTFGSNVDSWRPYSQWQHVAFRTVIALMPIMCDSAVSPGRSIEGTLAFCVQDTFGKNPRCTCMSLPYRKQLPHPCPSLFGPWPCTRTSLPRRKNRSAVPLPRVCSRPFCCALRFCTAKISLPCPCPGLFLPLSCPCPCPG